MYHNVTAKGQGLYGELKVAAQERQKLFLQEIEERLIAPLPPAASGRHTGQKRKGTASARVSDPSNLADPDSRISGDCKSKKIEIPRCSSKNKRGKFTNTCTIGLRAACQCHARLAPSSQKRWNSAHKSNRLFQFCS